MIWFWFSKGADSFVIMSQLPMSAESTVGGTTISLEGAKKIFQGKSVFFLICQISNIFKEYKIPMAQNKGGNFSFFLN